tara:strand:+ start:89 stop:874 length:786 start_codon:yes stop_codon:yes gene_type:complete
MQISLIITTYNQPDALMLVLKSVECQGLVPNEVIIADDGSNENTQELIADFIANSSLNIIHSFQKDKGFRAAKSRNKAISKAKSEYIILIDGDMILHRNFIYDHKKNAQAGYFVQGGRVLLSQKKSNEVLKNSYLFFDLFSYGLKNRKNAIYSNFLSKLFSRKKNYLRGLKTCNVAFYRKDCISVNGFNNNFEGWGREDSEFFIRLINKGITRKTLKFNAIQYHLWHDEASRNSLSRNDQLLKKTIDENLNWCDDGINNYL